VTDRRGFVDEPDPTPHSPRAAPADKAISDNRGWLPGSTGPAGPVRHEAVAALPGPAVGGGMSSWTLGAAAVLVLLGVLGLLEVANFIAAQFARAAWLGVLTLALVTPALAALFWSILREWRGYAALRHVEAIRAGLASEDAARARASAGLWLSAIGAAPATIEVAMRAQDAATLRALLRAGPARELEAATTEAGRRAALQVLAATAVSPWPGLDGIIVVWRALRLVREVARLHGMRPGTLGTLRLFRRVTMDAGAVAAADVAVSALAEALFRSPLAGGLAGHTAGAAVAAQRMLRLSHAIGQGCRPL